MSIQNNHRPFVRILFSLFGMALIELVQSEAAAQQPDAVGKLKQALHFYAPFDDTADARIAATDTKIYTAESLERKTLTPGIHRKGADIAKAQGRAGDCLRFTDRSGEVLCYPGTQMHYAPQNWSGAVSFWMRLTPDEDLKPGYCDPIQITQRAWNNAAFFVDFDKDVPRDFRLGVFSDLSHWNPENVAWEKWPVEKRPMVTVRKPPFSRSEWTHVAFTFEELNAVSEQPSTASLYLNGQKQGTIRQSIRFTWEPEKAAIMLGIEYIGDLDELMIFRRSLTPEEIQLLFQYPAPFPKL